MMNTCVNGLATGRDRGRRPSWFASHGPDHLLSQVKVPALITQGTVDTLFTLREAISNYASMRVHNIPTKMMWFCGGHGGCITGAGEAGHIERAVLAWFARYLDGDTSVQTGPRFEWLADDAQWRSAGDYPLPRRSSLTAIGSGRSRSRRTPSGALVAATVAANAVNVALPAAGARARGRRADAEAQLQRHRASRRRPTSTRSSWTPPDASSATSRRRSR